VLIPRPETEQVVEVAIAEARRLRASPLVAVDLGTGSGAIAGSLAVELGAEVWATDRSPDALAVARANVAGASATTVRLTEGDWFAALPDELAGTLQLVVANPPYVSDDELVTLAPEVRDHEPAGALFAGADGLDAYRAIVPELPRLVAPGGVAILEIGHEQTEAVGALIAATGRAWSLRRDLAGRPRAIIT